MDFLLPFVSYFLYISMPIKREKRVKEREKVNVFVCVCLRWGGRWLTTGQTLRVVSLQRQRGWRGEKDQLPEVKWDEGSVLIRAVIKSNDILKLLHYHEIPVN